MVSPPAGTSQTPVVALHVWPVGHADVLTHTPLAHTSLVQAMPSLHGAVLFRKTQPVAGLQVSSVHGLPSLQTSGVPAVQVPFWQVSTPLHALPSLQLVPLGSLASAGHEGPDPVQVSATSQGLAGVRHTVLELANPSAGQVGLVPEQVSATSQTPAAGRHRVPAVARTSAGQVALEPVQVSATSHAPAAGRQIAPAPANWQPPVQQAPPSQASPGSMWPLPHSPVAVTITCWVAVATPFRWSVTVSVAV
jgi:hypothetical protein